MTSKNRTVLQPEYMKEFNCIGAACEDSCCIGWRVDLDKKTYLKYKKSANPTLKPIIQKMVTRRHNQKSDRAYGLIKMGKDGRCPFLNEENLCNIYIHAGEDYLSDTCTFYPRFVKKVDGKLERTATISCPEVARLALLNPQGIAFEHIEDSHQNLKADSNLDTEGHLLINQPQRYFWDIRLFSLGLLQNRDYSLGDRLTMLGITYQKIEGLQSEGRLQDIPLMLESMADMIEAGSLKEELANIPTNTHIQMSLAKEMTNHRIMQGLTSQRYIECLKETLMGIGYKEGAKLIDVIDKYEHNYSQYLSPYLEEKEYILENYLVNEYFKEMMPFGSYKSIWDSYIFLCVLYSMVKLHLIGMAGYHKEMNDELIIKLIQSFSKTVLHNTQYIQHIVQLLKDNEYDSLAYMSILIKN